MDILTRETSRSVGRIPAFILTATVLAGFIPGVAADCWIDAYVMMHSCSFYKPFTVVSNLSSYGDEECDDSVDGLSYTVRIIIGLSVCNSPSPLVDQSHSLTNPTPLPPAFVFFAILSTFSLIVYRRRRAAQASLVYVQQAPQGRGGVNGSPYGPNGGPPFAPPQNPAQTYNGPSPTPAFVQV